MWGPRAQITGLGVSTQESKSFWRFKSPRFGSLDLRLTEPQIFHQHCTKSEQLASFEQDMRGGGEVCLPRA